MLDVGGGPDPFDLVANPFNGIYERPNIACHIIQEVDGRHPGSRYWRSVVVVEVVKKYGGVAIAG